MEKIATDNYSFEKLRENLAAKAEKEREGKE